MKPRTVTDKDCMTLCGHDRTTNAIDDETAPDGCKTTFSLELTKSRATDTDRHTVAAGRLNKLRGSMFYTSGARIIHQTLFIIITKSFCAIDAQRELDSAHISYLALSIKYTYVYSSHGQ